LIFSFLRKINASAKCRISQSRKEQRLGFIGTLSVLQAKRKFRPFLNEPLKRAQRKPMFVLELAGELFKFRAKTPALEVLSQLPPRWKARAAL